jgi:hypothetical protein
VGCADLEIGDEVLLCEHGSMLAAPAAGSCRADLSFSGGSPNRSSSAGYLVSPGLGQLSPVRDSLLSLPRDL